MLDYNDFADKTYLHPKPRIKLLDRVQLWYRATIVEYMIVDLNSRLISLDLAERQIHAERARLKRERAAWEARRDRIQIRTNFGV